MLPRGRMRNASEPSSASAVSENRLTIQRHRGRHARKDPEGDARVHDEHEVEEVRNDHDRVGRVQARERPLLGQLVRDEHRRREPQHERHQAVPARMIGRQRSQSVGVLRIPADGGAPRPAAAALLAVRVSDLDREARERRLAQHDAVRSRREPGRRRAPHDLELRDDEQLPEEPIARLLHEELEARVADVERHAGVERRADQLRRARLLEGLRRLAADSEQRAPSPASTPLVEPRPIDGREVGEVDAPRLVGHPEVVPDLLGRERQDRRHQANERVQDAVAGRLGRPALRRVRRRGVEPVLQDVEIERREVHRAEVVEALEREVELVRLVRLPHPLDRPVEPQHRPAVQARERGVRDRVRRRIEVGEVPEEEAAGVANPPVRLRQLAEDLVGQPDVRGVVLARRPEPQDLRPVLRDDVVRRHGVPDGLRHLAPGAVDHEPVGEDGAVRRAPAGAHGFEQGGVEPPAVLVRALQVHVRRPAQLGVLLQDGRVAASGVEPDVEDVGLLPERAAAALPARGPGGEQLRGRAEVPLVGALAGFHPRGDVLDDRLLEEDRAAGLAVERHDRDAPHALARDRPVGSVGDHVRDALLAPRRDPLDGREGGERLLAQGPGVPAPRRLVERDEPLLGRPEERRVLAAPAVGIRVGERHLGDQRAPLLQERDDPRVRVPDREPGEVGDLGDEAPVVVDRIVDRQPERPAELVVLLAVARGDVDQAGPRVHRDERGRRDPAGALDPGVPVLEPRELGPLEGPEAARGLEPRRPGRPGRRGPRPR